jgi:Icc-related predicted phosphoesterase
MFASDLHGRVERYKMLWQAIEQASPKALFLGGDLLPSGLAGMISAEPRYGNFVNDFLIPGFEEIRNRLGRRYPKIYLILGNDDGRFEEDAFLDASAAKLWIYAHNRIVQFENYRVLGYSFVPPTPFMLKDWERYDVSRYTPHGCVSPEDGWRGKAVPKNEIRYSTIQVDLERLTKNSSLENAICLFHSPPYETNLDRVANDGKMIDHAPLDLHVGSIAIQRFIEQRQPLLSLHGHVHESARLTGSWKDRIGRTHLFGAAHDGEELALVSFDLEDLDSASRELI